MKQPRGTDIRTVSRCWSKLPESIAHEISLAARPHPLALLINDLNFEYVHDRLERVDTFYNQHRLQITTRNDAKFVSRPFCRYRHNLRDVAPSDFEPKPIRSYWCHSFGYSNYDRYQIRSDRASYLRLGRVVRGPPRRGYRAREL